MPLSRPVAYALLVLAACAPPAGSLTTHTLDAEAVDQVYTVRVYEPAGATGPLPVVVLFDGDDWTRRTARLVDALLEEDAIVAPLVVSVGYGDTPNQRARDLTPPGPGVPEGHGGIEPFFTFLEDQLVPWVDAEHDTLATPEGRVLMGHSFGGLATTWGLFEARDTFHHGIALSPSLVFAEGLLFELEEAWADEHANLSGRLYLGAGSLEDHSLAGLTEAFGARLDARDHPDLDLRTELSPGLTHVDLFPVGAEAGLRFVLEAP